MSGMERNEAYSEEKEITMSLHFDVTQLRWTREPAEYVVTIVVLVLTSVRKKREYQPPASLGLPYFREDR